MKTTFHSSRRDFLKTNATLAAAAALTAFPAHQRVHAAGSDALKLGLIGAGGRGRGAVIDAFQADPNVKLTALCDTFADRAKNSLNLLKNEFADRVEVSEDRCFSGLDGYKNVIESADVVLIACGSRFHPFYTLKAVEAGKHVFVEKPHALDAFGLRLVEKATGIAAKNNTALVSGLCYRYDTLRQEAFKRIAEGQLGEITAVQCDYIRSPYSLVSREPQWTETEYQFRNWYHFTWLAGDEILQSLLHNIDSVMTAFGEEHPVRAYGVGGRSTEFVTEMGDQYDHNAAVLEFADGKRIYGATRTARNCYTSNLDVLHGTKGRCIFRATGTPIFTDLKGKTTWTAGARERNMYVQEHYEMLRSIAAGKPINDGKRMTRTTMSGILAFMACRSGMEVKWDDALEANAILGPKEEEISLTMTPPLLPEENGLYPVSIPGRMPL